jgi:hypothetical protein
MNTNTPHVLKSWGVRYDYIWEWFIKLTLKYRAVAKFHVFCPLLCECKSRRFNLIPVYTHQSARVSEGDHQTSVLCREETHLLASTLAGNPCQDPKPRRQFLLQSVGSGFLL